MEERRSIEDELERERDKLHRMLEGWRSAYEKTDEAVIEQSRKVDRLIAGVQKQVRIKKSDTEHSK